MPEDIYYIYTIHMVVKHDDSVNPFGYISASCVWGQAVERIVCQPTVRFCAGCRKTAFSWRSNTIPSGNQTWQWKIFNSTIYRDFLSMHLFVPFLAVNCETTWNCWILQGKGTLAPLASAQVFEPNTRSAAALRFAGPEVKSEVSWRCCCRLF